MRLGTIRVHPTINSEKFIRRAVYHNLYVQYHDLGSLTSNFEYFVHTRPCKSDPNLISSVRLFSKMAAFQGGRFH